MNQLNVGGYDIFLNGEPIGEDLNPIELNFVKAPSGLLVPDYVVSNTQQEVSQIAAKNSQNTQEIEIQMSDYLEEKGYEVIDFEMKKGIEFNGERVYSARVKIKQGGEIKTGIIKTRTTFFRTQTLNEYAKNTKYKKIYDVMRGNDWGPNKKFFDRITDEAFAFIGDQQTDRKGEVVTGKLGYEQTKEVGQNPETALLNHIQHQIMVERAFEETTYDIWELRQQGLKNGKFSINNITNGYASKDIEILLKREEKLGEQIFARNRSGEIVNLYLDWIVYETKGEHRCDFDGGNANRLLALSGAGNGDDSGGIHGLRLSFHGFDIRNDVSARVAL